MDSVRATHKWFADPVIFIVKDIAVPVKQVSEELPQVVIIRLLKEVQPPHIPQVGGHLFCSKREDIVKLETRLEEEIKQHIRQRKLVGFTDQGSFHKALQWASPVWCPQFSDISPLKCPPRRETGKNTYYTQNFIKYTGAAVCTALGPCVGENRICLPWYCTHGNPCSVQF